MLRIILRWVSILSMLSNGNVMILLPHLPCGTKFLRVLIFAIFAAICKNKFPKIKIAVNIFPAKIYLGVNIL